MDLSCEVEVVPAAARAFEVLPGRYWLVGYQDEARTSPVFKQEKPTPEAWVLSLSLSEHDALRR